MSDMVDKWGRAVAGRGFAQVPNYLLLINRFLEEESRLSPTELLVLIELVGTWWKKTEKPFPSLKTLATRCNVSDRQMQRSINSLLHKGIITKEKRRNKGIIASNSYDMQPLADLLAEIAKAFPNEYPRRDSMMNLEKLVGKNEDAQSDNSVSE